jgi:hypothetical protein
MRELHDGTWRTAFKGEVRVFMYVCMSVSKRFFLRCPTPRLHRFLSSHWPSFRKRYSGSLKGRQREQKTYSKEVRCVDAKGL